MEREGAGMEMIDNETGQVKSEHTPANEGHAEELEKSFLNSLGFLAGLLSRGEKQENYIHNAGKLVQKFRELKLEEEYCIVPLILNFSNQKKISAGSLVKVICILMRLSKSSSKISDLNFCAAKIIAKAQEARFIDRSEGIYVPGPEEPPCSKSPEPKIAIQEQDIDSNQVISIMDFCKKQYSDRDEAQRLKGRIKNAIRKTSNKPKPKMKGRRASPKTAALPSLYLYSDLYALCVEFNLVKNIRPTPKLPDQERVNTPTPDPTASNTPKIPGSP
jgi:hypothetical protein